MKAHTHFRKGRRAQGGAAAVFAAIALLAAITAAMLAIEVGRIYAAQSALQKQANLASLDAARVVGGCSVDDATPVETDPVVLQTDVEVLIDQIISSAGLSGTVSRQLSAGGNAEGVEVGTIETFVDPATGTTQRRLLSSSSSGSTPEAVRVTLQRQFPTPFMPIFPSQAGKLMTATATAEQSVIGSFWLSSGVADIELLKPLLGGLLGVDVSLLDGVDGLASVGVSLPVLATAVGLDVEDLSDPLALQAENPLLGDLLDGLADGLTGTANATVVGLLRDLADAAASSGNTVPLGELFPTVDDGSGDAPVVNLLDLLMAVGMATHADPSGGVTPIAITGLPSSLVSIPGVADVQVGLRILQPPQFAIGRAGEAKAKTAQVQLGLRIEAGAILNGIVNAVDTAVDAVAAILGGILGLDVDVDIASGPLNIGVDVDVAQAEATLDRIQCPRSSSPELVTSVTPNSALAQVRIGTFTGSAASMPDLDTSTDSWSLAHVSIDASSVCIGVNLFGLCLGIPQNLGESDLQLGLKLTSLDVGAQDLASLDFDEFEVMDDEVKPPTYLADGAPGSDVTTSENPRTVGSPLQIGLSLGLTTEQSGSGLIGVLGGLVATVLNTVTAAVQGLLDIVNALAASLIDPLLQLLGIQLGTATVTMNSVTLDNVQLVSMETPAAE